MPPLISCEKVSPLFCKFRGEYNLVSARHVNAYERKVAHYLSNDYYYILLCSTYDIHNIRVIEMLCRIQVAFKLNANLSLLARNLKLPASTD